jgi:hypothetical protein
LPDLGDFSEAEEDLGDLYDQDLLDFSSRRRFDVLTRTPSSAALVKVANASSAELRSSKEVKIRFIDIVLEQD